MKWNTKDVLLELVCGAILSGVILTTIGAVVALLVWIGVTMIDGKGW